MNEIEFLGQGGISAKVIKDSLSPWEERLTTLQLRYPRWILAEFNTHRIFSRNSSSSRAIPVNKMIEMVENDPAIPIHWGKNQAGMQAERELTESEKLTARTLWLKAAKNAVNVAKEMTTVGLHKQVANRILEPFQFMNTIVSSTDWSNFFSLRCHKDAQPEIQELAYKIRAALNASIPTPLNFKEWHLPYVLEEEKEQFHIEDQVRISVARCCRVSYMKHDGSHSSVEEDIKLHNRLAKAHPPHLSPTEHVATPAYWFRTGPKWCGNFKGWVQYRKLLEHNAIHFSS